MNTKFRQYAPTFLLFLCCAVRCQIPAAELPAGKVVYWGRDYFWEDRPSEHTNGVVKINDEILSNVVSVVANTWDGSLLRSDGTIIDFGSRFHGGIGVQPGLSNVISIAAEGNMFWAITRGGTVARWWQGGEGLEIVPGLTNVAAITSSGFSLGSQNYLALKNDGTVIGFRFDPSGYIDPSTLEHKTSEPPFQFVKIGPPDLTDVTALALIGDSPVVLKRDGALLQLIRDEKTNHIEFTDPLYRFSATEPIVVNNRPLTDILAVSAQPGQHALALRRNGAVVVWETNHDVSFPVPTTVTDVVAIATGTGHDLALKRDGTVVAWGNNSVGQASVPTGLSNVVAIAAGMDFSMAITTGSIPSSVYVRPHGRLEELSQEADLVFKGQVVSSLAVSNQFFPDWGNTHATVFRVLSVLQGQISTNQITLWHMTHGPNVWGGGSEPSWQEFKPGDCFLIFADTLAKPGYLYSPPSDAQSRSNEFRQVYRDGFTHTLDARVLKASSVKETHWLEFNLLLHDSNPSNALYAIDRLDSMSLAGRSDDRWMHSKDFKRNTVLTALLPLVTSTNEEIAVRALNCFATESNLTTCVEPFAKTLVKVANESSSSKCRLAAIGSLSGTHGDDVSAALLRLLSDGADDVRVNAVRLLPRFPEAFAESALRKQAGDPSADVRSVVADVIGDGKFVPLLPTLAKLFADPVGKDAPIKPLTIDQLKAGQRLNNIGDVHTSAGLALVKFPPNQVATILKTNLDDPGFHINFVAKLAQGEPEPWLPELVGILDARFRHVEEFDTLPPDDPKRYSDYVGNRILTGTYTKCWEDIRQYLLKKPQEELSSPEMNRYMDLLEKMVRPVPDCPGCSIEEARWLYQLYWTKNLAERVRALRQKYDKTEGWWFDAFEKGIRGEADPVGAPSF